MKSYTWLPISEGDKSVPIPKNGWVTYDDAEAEIAAAVQRAREEIVKELEKELQGCRDVYDMGLLWAIGLIKRRGEKKTQRTCFLCGAPVDSEPVVVRLSLIHI